MFISEESKDNANKTQHEDREQMVQVAAYQSLQNKQDLKKKDCDPGTPVLAEINIFIDIQT